MGWLAEWKAISDRIKGLLEAGQLLFLSIRDTSTENRSVFKNILIPHAKKINEDIMDFYDNNKSIMSAACAESILSLHGSYAVACRNSDSGRGQQKRLELVQELLTSLASFRAEFDFHLSDKQVITKRITERAFLHLQRSIVADPGIRANWKKAFGNGETKCEKLGAVHLLLHGIWAFKALAEGERTDLVLQAPLKDISLVEETSEGLVLTEWKVVKDNNLEQVSDEAFKQAKRYGRGILGGIELTTYRYLVLVSLKNIVPMPEKRRDDDNIVYKYINIAVDPDTPSKDAHSRCAR